MSRRWTLDLFAYPLGSTGRRAFLALLVDDDSRLVVGFGMHRQLCAGRLQRVVRIALGRFGPPREILFDHGLHAVLRGKCGRSHLYQELEKHRIVPVWAKPNDALQLGKCEQVYDTLLRECDALEVAQDLDSARRGLRAFLHSYNERHRQRHEAAPTLATAPEVHDE